MLMIMAQFEVPVGIISPDIINLVRGFNVGDDGYIYDYGSNSVDFDSCGNIFYSK